MSAKLPKPIASATDQQLLNYITEAGLHPGGDKRVMVEEILRLRKMLGLDITKQAPAPVPTQQQEEEDPLA